MALLRVLALARLSNACGASGPRAAPMWTPAATSRDQPRPATTSHDRLQSTATGRGRNPVPQGTETLKGYGPATVSPTTT